MELNEIREARYRQPFEPFALQLRNGRQLSVWEPQLIAIAPQCLLVISDDEAVTLIDPETVESIVRPIPIKVK